MPLSPSHYNPVGFLLTQLCPNHLFIINLKGPHIEMPNSPEGYNPVGS